MAHKAGHKKVQQYKIYGLNQLYNGPVVKIGKEIYSTKGGTLEGFSQRLVPVSGDINVPMDEPTRPTMGGPTGTNAQEMGEFGNMGAGGGISPNIGNQGGGMSGGDTGGGGY